MFAALIGAAASARMAVLIAGSNGYSNYRHQADISNMYTQLINRGWQAKDIIQMCYDDIANNARNPFQGQIFHTTDHKNIYPGSDSIAYKGKTVNAKNFCDVLTTLPTTTNDLVYVYYDNHGGPDILGVPDGCGSYIYSRDLVAAFNTMNQRGKYKKLFFGIEACYSGSVANKFTAPNMCTITAANDKESSYAAVYDSAIGAYLSNEFSNYWMHFMDAQPEATIGELYEFVKSSTTGSHVCWFGDETMKSMKIADFLGMPNTVSNTIRPIAVDAVPQSVATKATLHHLMTAHQDLSIRSRARLESHRLAEASKRLEIVLSEIVKAVDIKNYNAVMTTIGGPSNDAYFEVLDHFFQKFGAVNGDDLPRLNVFINLCQSHSSSEIIKAIDATL